MMKLRPISLLLLGLLVVGMGAVRSAHGQFPGRGDDVTPSLGRFNVVVDPHFEFPIKNNPGYAPYLSNKGGNLNFTSPILFDPTTTIGRSDPLLAGSAEDTAGVLAGNLPPRLLRDDQFTVKPSFAEGPAGTREVHTYIESIHLTGSGFEVRAGSQAPLRPHSVGEVESLSGNSGDPAQDFPANSFFDVFVQVEVPSLGGFPTVELVNVDPLLVQSASITSFPPKVLYIHGNSSAVPMYFNKDVPAFGVHRGDLFGQLTLAGHGVGFRQSDVAEFEAAETEAETTSGRLPLQDNPIMHVTIVDEISDLPTPTPSPTSTPTAKPTAALCVGDCDGQGAVTVDEIITLVNLVLGNAGACANGLPAGVTPDVTWILQAVNHALSGCGS